MVPRIPDWQLPAGVDRGLWDYLHSEEMVSGYDAMMEQSPLAMQDVRFCFDMFPKPGDLIDLGCGTGRLAIPFAQQGFRCTGVDLSPVMLHQARANAAKLGVSVEFVERSLLELDDIPGQSFDYAACLFSTLGMIRGTENRQKALQQFHRLLRPGGLLVLHIHRRWFRGLGFKLVCQQLWRTALKKPDAGDVTMPQHYAGAPLTLHHFTWGEVRELLAQAGFVLKDYETVRDANGVYGYLLLTQKPTPTDP